jgi:hypothetical protein
MLTERLGFTGMVLLMGVINLLNIPVVIGIFRGRRERASTVEAETS